MKINLFKGDLGTGILPNKNTGTAVEMFRVVVDLPGRHMVVNTTLKDGLPPLVLPQLLPFCVAQKS